MHCTSGLLVAASAKTCWHPVSACSQSGHPGRYQLDCHHTRLPRGGSVIMVHIPSQWCAETSHFKATADVGNVVSNIVVSKVHCVSGCAVVFL